MQSNESKAKPAAPAQAETVSADRRAFMKTVVTGTVAAGLVASAGKAEAAAADPCGNPVQVPPSTVRAKLLVSADGRVTRDQIINVIGDIFNGSNCPNCGLIGIPDDPREIKDILVAKAHLPAGTLTMVVFEDP
jgi:hypothetical protein